MKAPIFVVLAFLVNSALAHIFPSSDLQRKFLGDTFKFQWAVTGAVRDFVIYNQTTGASVNPHPRVGLTRWSYHGNTITLTITSVALWDAGNYTLSINNGIAWENDSSALLFVFVSGSVSLNLTLGRNPPTEGDSVELTCAYTSNSQPVAYRPGMVYSWYLSRIGYTLQVLSNGSLQTPNGDIVSGYNTRNNGKTLRIASVQYNAAAQYIYCYVKEDGSNLSSTNSFYINVQYLTSTRITDVSREDLVSAVIALAIVLGIALLAIIGMLIGFFVWKRRHYISTSNPARPNRSGTKQSETNQSETDHYQEMDRQTSENRIYTNLDHTEGI